jgi:hypothetical protein
VSLVMITRQVRHALAGRGKIPTRTRFGHRRAAVEQGEGLASSVMTYISWQIVFTPRALSYRRP